MFPLPFLNEKLPLLEHALMFTPFPYQMYFPVAVYMGKIAGVQLLAGLMMQFGWVLMSYCLARFMWQRGVKKYSAFGG
jgi:ABC-2 type transport system permease protein